MKQKSDFIDPDDEFVEPEDFMRMSKQTSFKDTVLMQLRRIAEIGSKEFTAGYTEKRIIHGSPVEKYHTDKREEYCNAIDMLYDLLLPEATVDEKFGEEFGKIIKDEEEEFKRCMDIKDEDKRRNEWLRSKIKLRRRLLQQLSLLLWRLDYLQVGVYRE